MSELEEVWRSIIDPVIEDRQIGQQIVRGSGHDNNWSQRYMGGSDVIGDAPVQILWDRKSTTNDTNFQIQTGSGILQQMSNQSTYTDLDIEEMRRILEEFNQPPNITLYTGSTGAERYNEALQSKYDELQDTAKMKEIEKKKIKHFESLPIEEVIDKLYL